MGTELVGPFLEEDNMEIPSIPPGFESFAPFNLNRTEANQVSNFSRSANAPEARSIQLETSYDSNDNSKTSKSLKRRTWDKYNQFNSSSGDESVSEQNKILRDHLPRGVIRGCETCKNCQKVMAKWQPREARRPNLEQAPVFYPSEEEFEDTLKYISSIRAEAESYGICRIVPPPSWKPPCPLKGRDIWERSKFTTRVQRIDKLQNRYSMRKIPHVNEKRRKKKRCLKNGVDDGNGIQEIKVAGAVEAERFGFEPGPDFSLDVFQRYADDFKSQYFGKNDIGLNLGTSMLGEKWQPSVEDIEGEYWRMVEKPTEEIEVLYGADLETRSFGSGFPKTPLQVASASDMKYIHSGWNLNNFPRLPGSVLSFENSEISGVLVPWLYIGMCFSSFCWHVEDHHLYSLNYMHWGAPKIWYGVPGTDAHKLEAAMRKRLPDLFEEQPDLLHKLVTQLSPSILRSEGVPVYRCVQSPGEFVLTFPRAYHAGFSCGFNCAEAVNVAPVDWLPYGQNAIDLYCKQGRQTTISHDKLLLGAAREAVKANWEFNLLRKRNKENLRWKEVCGKDGILSKVLKTRVEMEQKRRELLCKSSQALKMESSFDANSERECSVCHFDLHLSAAGCHHCSPDKYACLNHAKQLCSCSWGAKFFLFRYEISELNILVEALEGKLSAVYRWARLDLGLSLSTYVSKENKQISGQVGKFFHGSQEGAPKEMTLARNGVSAKDHADGGSRSLTNCDSSKPSFQNPKPPVVVLALEIVKASSNSISQKPDNISKKENYLQLMSSQVDPPKKAMSSENSASQKCEMKQSSFPEKKGVILLSADEGEKPGEESSVENGTPVKCTSVQKLVLPKTTATLSTPIVTEPSEMPERSGCVSIKVEELSDAERHVGKPNDSSCITLTDLDQSKDMLRNDEGSADCGPKQKRKDDEKFKSDDGESKTDITVSTSSLHQNNLDRYYRQKGPRIAKVVRRINCSVEALDFGTVCEGKLWCDSQAIYPKGFRSRVRYIDVVDPTNMCYYVSEILDAGRGGPLFMVSVEHCPSEVFIHISATRCWEMVRERVNHEIAKQHKLGRGKLPPLQPPGSLDGMEMFGFSSPAIVQAIQSMDKKRSSTEYWKLRPLLQISEQAADSSINLDMKCEPMGEQDTSKSNDPRVERIVNGLFKKSSPQELQLLYSLLNNKNSSDEQSLLMRFLNEEISKRPR